MKSHQRQRLCQYSISVARSQYHLAGSWWIVSDPTYRKPICRSCAAGATTAAWNVKGRSAGAKEQFSSGAVASPEEEMGAWN